MYIHIQIVYFLQTWKNFFAIHRLWNFTCNVRCKFYINILSNFKTDLPIIVFRLGVADNPPHSVATTVKQIPSMKVSLKMTKRFKYSITLHTTFENMYASTNYPLQCISTYTAVIWPHSHCQQTTCIFFSSSYTFQYKVASSVLTLLKIYQVSRSANIV